MTIVGFNFTSINAEKTGSSDNVRVESNVGVVNIVESKIPDPKKAILKFEFMFSAKFEPGIGRIELKGELVEMFDKELANKILEGWNKNSLLHKDIAPRVLNAILARSNVEAILMSKELGLPSPIQLPKVELKSKSESVASEDNKNKKSTTGSSDEVKSKKK
ncbi:MAG: hypothetical protein KatS3mg002_0004 [Candidatus Woesearchaeota archaeon]|nr:MAG: hypothetical protein KatS3mg002_0004 [Candidatus Woesearchaeota archaeon]